MHLIFEGQTNKVVDSRLLAEYLMGSITVSGMTWILGPMIHKGLEGLQGFCILAESHTSIHIKPGGYLFGDLFSCKPFSSRAVMLFAEENLYLTIETWDVLQRGLEFLDDVSLAEDEGVDDGVTVTGNGEPIGTS